MVRYDAAVIHSYAEALYSRAESIKAGHAIVYGILGIVAGSIFGGTGFAVMGGLIACAIGYAVGEQKGFVLKLQAQLALCQVEIERNGRGAGPAALAAE
ncbi:MAG TPA: hypothetical protein VGB70_05840 [Allosphingosinicella sp.]|jgi:uncharacterized membrane protein